MNSVFRSGVPRCCYVESDIVLTAMLTGLLLFLAQRLAFSFACQAMTSPVRRLLQSLTPEPPATALPVASPTVAVFPQLLVAKPGSGHSPSF